MKTKNEVTLRVMRSHKSSILRSTHTHRSAMCRCAFVFGHEVNGVSDEAIALCDLALEIPQEGSKHSLNISVCAGVVAWDFVSKTSWNHLKQKKSRGILNTDGFRSIPILSFLCSASFKFLMRECKFLKIELLETNNSSPMGSNMHYNSWTLMCDPSGVENASYVFL